MRPPGVAVLLGLGLALPARAQSRYGLRGEAGAEYDTNPGRVETVREGIAPLTTPSPLGRFVVSGNAVAAPGGGQTLSLGGSVAGKMFTRPAAKSENVLVAQASANWSLPVGESTAIALAAAYFDVW